MCQYTLFDVGGVEIYEYKRSKQCRRCRRYSTDFKALNAMLCMSKTSKMVFAAFTQHCIESTVTHLTHVEDVEDAKYYCTLYTGPLAPPGGRHLMCLPPCGFSGSHPVSPRRQLCFKTFWDLSNYKGNCRQDTPPIPSS